MLGGTLALFGSLAYAEIAVLYPRAGGNYVFLREGYGRLAGFLWGWVEFWIIRTGSLAALATMFTRSLHQVLRELLSPRGEALLEPWLEILLTLLVLVGLALVNVRGVRWGGVVQLLITTVKVVSLLAILLLPFAALAFLPTDSSSRPSTEHLQPVWPTSFAWNMLAGFGAAVLAVQWAYHGWMNIAPVAGEIAQPQRNIPLALLAGIATIIVLYLGANLAYCLVLPHDELVRSTNERTVEAFARALLGSAGAALAAAALMVSAFGALNGNLLVGPRLLYAMGEDRMVPEALARVHPHFRTPVLSILLMTAWACLLVVAAPVFKALGWLKPGVDVFDQLTDYAMFGAVLFETLAVSTIFVFRRRFPDAVRPYRCPGYPVVPAVYVVLLALVAVSVFVNDARLALTGVVFIAVGGLVYFFFLRPSDPTPAPQELVKMG